MLWSPNISNNMKQEPGSLASKYMSEWVLTRTESYVSYGKLRGHILFPPVVTWIVILVCDGGIVRGRKGSSN